jgi:superfamily II RNA helicase
VVQTEEVIAAGPDNITVERLAGMFEFPLDKFQEKAVRTFLEGSSVVVCAPTGAG